MKGLMAVLSAWVLSGTSITAELPTAEVARVDVPQVYRFDGVVEAVKESTVSAQTAGQVTKALFDVDDFVEAGALLVVLKDNEQRAHLKQAEANLKVAKAQLDDAQKEHGRIEGVFAKTLVSRQDMDKASAALATAQAQHDAAFAAVTQAREQLAYTRIHAPYTGIVTERLVQVGEMVQPGTPLMTGVSLDQLRVLVDVPQTLISKVRRHDSAQIRLPSDGWIHAERITVFPYADRRSNSFKVRLDLPTGSHGLFPGMFVKTGFVTGATDALVVPDESVIFRSEVTGVYLVGQDGRVVLRHVRLGRPLGDGRIAVLAGLSEGEQVATDTIAAGVLLKAQRAEPQDANG